jgi:dTDP-4-amino-4,6-dideoxygalactose transaminase
MSKYSYNPWPLGKLPEEWQRPEPNLLKAMGYSWDDPRDIIDLFEGKVADYWGAKYAVAVDCCSHALFLSLMLLKKRGEIDPSLPVTIPSHTYISVPMQVEHAGLGVEFVDFPWRGYYYLSPTRVVDASVMWSETGYIDNTLMCLSFQLKKAVPIGRGGIILTNDADAFTWLKLASYDGRDLTTPYDADNHVAFKGWHYYMTPEDAARGILLMDQVGDKGAFMGSENYPDVSKMMRNI